MKQKTFLHLSWAATGLVGCVAASWALLTLYARERAGLPLGLDPAVALGVSAALMLAAMSGLATFSRNLFSALFPKSDVLSELSSLALAWSLFMLYSITMFALMVG